MGYPAMCLIEVHTELDGRAFATSDLTQGLCLEGDRGREGDRRSEQAIRRSAHEDGALLPAGDRLAGNAQVARKLCPRPPELFAEKADLARGERGGVVHQRGSDRPVELFQVRDRDLRETTGGAPSHVNAQKRHG